MNKEVNDIGEVFRETLKNHRIEIDADLWGRLESQLSSQPQVISPKASLLKNLPFLKVAAAATLVVSIALAYNYIYIPLVSPEQNAKPIYSTTKEVNVIDDSLDFVHNENINNEIDNKAKLESPTEHNLINKENSKLNNNADISISDQKPSNSNNSTSNNNYSNLSQNNPQLVTFHENKPIINNADSINDNESVKTENTTSFVKPIELLKDQQSTKTEEENFNLQIPNVFTPNSDGINDYFVIRNLDIFSTNQLIITNRFGKVVFEKINYQNNWDVINIPDGVYYYVLKCRIKNSDFVKTGMVTIAR